MANLTQDPFSEKLDSLGLRPTTKGLINNIYLDLPLTMAQCDDFGVQSNDHYRALKAVLMQDSSEDFEVGDLFEVDEFFAYLSKIEIRKSKFGNFKN